MAIAVAALPLQAEAKPDKKDKNRGARSGEMRKGSQKKGKAQVRQKSQSRPKQNINKSQGRSKPKMNKASSGGQEAKSKKSSAARQQANVGKPKQRAKQQKVAKAQSRANVQKQNKGAGARNDMARGERRSPELRKNAVASSQAGKKAGRRNGDNQGAGTRKDAQRDQREQVAALRGDRERTQVNQRDGKRPNVNRRGDEASRRAERRGERRDWNKIDRRPARVDTPEERQRKLARSEWRQKAEKERKQRISQRKERDRDRVENFRRDRQKRIAAVRQQRQSIRTVKTEVRHEYVKNVRKEVHHYWHDRGDEVRYHVADRCDDLFHDDWWENRRWRNRHVVVNNPWWWWKPARFSTVNVFLNAGWNEPVLYDYGTDVIYDDSEVYVHGVSVGSPVAYSEQVITLANPTVDVIAEAPVVESEWTPLGVWALVQEDQGDAVMFFQLSVDQDGMISGAYVNVVSGEELPVVGQVDRSTQRAAWHIGDQTEKVFEAGMANLTQEEASCLVHLSPGEMQPWLLVRMESPDLPDQAAAISTAQGGE